MRGDFLGAGRGLVSLGVKVGVGVSLLLALYVSGGLVTFDDPSDTGFPLTVFSLQYPAVLPVVHRLLALIVVAVWVGLTMGLRGRPAYPHSLATLLLMVAQSAIGAFIAQDARSGVLGYLVLAHFSVSGLVIIAGGLTLVRAWW